MYNIKGNLSSLGMYINYDNSMSIICQQRHLNIHLFVIHFLPSKTKKHCKIVHNNYFCFCRVALTAQNCIYYFKYKVTKKNSYLHQIMSIINFYTNKITLPQLKSTPQSSSAPRVVAASCAIK